LKDIIDQLKLVKDYSNFDFDKIAPVTLVEIDTLITYSAQFKNGSLNLITLFDEFHSYVDYNKEKVKNVVDFNDHIRNHQFHFRICER
jgi:hypothetical protein